MGGSNDPSNLIEVSVEEHAELHLSLYLEYGHWQDWVAWNALSGQITIDEARRESARNYMTNRVVSDETKRRISEGKKGQSPWIAGKKHAPESIVKMKMSAIANRGRGVMCVETQQKWDSPLLAELDLGIKAKQIRKAADPNQPRNKSAKGLHFVFV